MATTGELRAIVEELELIDIGDAASYLGEESTDRDAALQLENARSSFDDLMGLLSLEQDSSCK